MCGRSLAAGYLGTTARAWSGFGNSRGPSSLHVRNCWKPRREMGRRIDYLDDPDAPEATSLVPSVNVGVLNEDGELLLIRRTDNENWAMPGGAMDIGETIAEAG